MLINLKGSSICLAPAQVRIMNDEEKIQNIIFFWGLNLHEVFFFFLVVKTISNTILANRAITPPNLLGIDRRIA
jgi:hypothetical protein